MDDSWPQLSKPISIESRTPWLPQRRYFITSLFIEQRSLLSGRFAPSLYIICTREKSVAECLEKPCDTW